MPPSKTTPILDQRLAASTMAGYTGTLRLNFYRQHHQLGFDNGRLTTITPYTPTTMADGDALFPDQTFLQLLFGHRTLAELEYAHTDCYATNFNADALLNILFPQQPSKPLGLG